ncbi:hypothetical protein [Alcanivorax sp.]|jgi:hypothetical protein|uniref:hypothetical protein n=1 Tax=Alcanivorax sp. TaxID=1872427 RepID=UPI0032D8B5AB
MRYDPKTQRLETDAGELIKEISCPLSKKWDQLMPWADDWAQSIGQNPSGLELGGEWYSWAQLEERGLQPPEPVPARKKYCGSCQKCVIDVNSYTEAQIQAVCEVDEQACIHLRLNHPELTVVNVGTEEDGRACGYEGVSRQGLPIVQTARTLAALEDGVRRGCRPLFVSTEPQGKVKSKLSIICSTEQKYVQSYTDFRLSTGIAGSESDESVEITIWHDRDRDPSPLAAYLIPPTLSIGARVYIADVIEEIVARTWNQGDSYRLTESEATWEGDGFAIDPPRVSSIVG